MLGSLEAQVPAAGTVTFLWQARFLLKNEGGAGKNTCLALLTDELGDR
jgi:hypothetical protein